MRCFHSYTTQEGSANVGNLPVSPDQQNRYTFAIAYRVAFFEEVERVNQMRVRIVASVITVLLLIAPSYLVSANPTLTVVTESRVNGLNSGLPTPTGQNPPSPLPRFPQAKQNEPSIAVNPLNSLNLIAGANDEQAEPRCEYLNGNGVLNGLTECPFADNIGTSGLYTSTNGGKTWTDLGLLDTVSAAALAGWAGLGMFSAGDPAVAFDASGNAYYANIHFPRHPASTKLDQ